MKLYISRTTYPNIVKILTGIVNGTNIEELKGNFSGICHIFDRHARLSKFPNIYRYLHTNLAGTSIFKTWQYYSGHPTFPVPANYGHLKGVNNSKLYADDMFMGDLDSPFYADSGEGDEYKWEGIQLQLRQSLAAHILKHLERSEF